MVTDDDNERVMREPWCSFCSEYGHSADSHLAQKPDLEKRVADIERELARLREASSGPTVANPVTLSGHASAEDHIRYRRPVNTCPERLGQDGLEHLRPELGSVEDHIQGLRDRASGKGD